MSGGERGQSPDPSLRERLSAAAYRAGWAVTARIPAPAASWLFDRIADRVSGNGTGPDQLRLNLERVVGPENVTRRLVRDSMRSYMRYWREAFQLPAIQGPGLVAELQEGFDPVERERLTDALAEGRGAILTLPHSGNWDMAGVWLVDLNGTFTTVAERLRPESLFEDFVRYRETLGFRIIALTGSEVPPFEQMVAVLEAGGVICLMGERDLGGSGVQVDFFGERTSMPPGPVALAQRTGAPLFVVHSYFTPGGWGFRINERLDTDRPLEEAVQEQADQMAANIALNPADWHMLQPIWFADLSESRRRRLGLEA